MQLPLQETVEAILDGVVRPAGHLTGDVGPLAAVRVVKLNNQCVLFCGPLVFLNGRAKVEYIAVAALLRVTQRQVLCDLNPRFTRVHAFHDHCVLFRRPLLTLLLLAEGAADRLEVDPLGEGVHCVSSEDFGNQPNLLLAVNVHALLEQLDLKSLRVEITYFVDAPLLGLGLGASELE